MRPFIVIWEMTQACDLACKHCRAEASPNRNSNELDFEESKSLLQEISDFGLPRPLVVLTGGDPLKREDLYELISFARNLGLAVAIAPSATPLLNFESIEKIHNAGASAISLSLDAASKEIHDGFRGEPGTFDRTLEAIQSSKKVGLRLQINTSVTQATVSELPKIASMVAGFKVSTWSLFMLVQTGRGKDLVSLTGSETEDVFYFLKDLSPYIPIKVTEAPHYRRVIEERNQLVELGKDWTHILKPGKLYFDLRTEVEKYDIISGSAIDSDESTQKRPPLVINSGNGFAFISHIGDVYPSGFLPVRGGNVREESLSEIYKNSTVFRNLRDYSLYEGKCGVCEFNSVCGGSRSRAYSMSGNYLGDDPTCNYIPKNSNA